MTTEHEQALSTWLNRLDQQPLPVLPANLARVQTLLKDANVALKDLGRVIAADPAMCLHVMRVAVRQHRSRLGGAPGSIHQCISIIGLSRLRPLLAKLKPLPDSEDSPARQGYLRSLGQSLHATTQIGGWLRYRSQPGADQLLQASLIYGAAQWGLWHVAGDDMLIIERLVTAERIPQDEAERAVLGCTREQIARGLAERWRFPQEVREALDPLQRPSLGFLLRCSRRATADPNYRLPHRDPAGQAIRSAGMTLRLGEWLAQETERGWYSLNTRRCLAIIAVYLTIPRDELLRITQGGALFVSRYWQLPGLAAPACRLLWPIQPRRPRRIKPRQLSAAVTRLRAIQADASAPATTGKPPAPARPATVPPPVAPKPTPPRPIGMANDHLPPELDRSRILNAPAPPPPAPPPPAPATHRHAGFKSADKKQEFEQFLQKLLREPEYFQSEPEVLRAVVEQLHACSNLDRVLVAKVAQGHDQIETYFALGCEDAPALKRLRINLQPVNLFTHLIKQPAGAWICPDRPNPMNSLVPGALKQASPCSDFLTMSVFNLRGPTAVFYADRGRSSRTGLSEPEYNLFKAACTACSKHLIARARRAVARRTPE